MVITQKLFKLQPYGLTCVVILTCGCIDNILVELKNVSATCIAPSSKMLLASSVRCSMVIPLTYVEHKSMSLHDFVLSVYHLLIIYFISNYT